MYNRPIGDPFYWDKHEPCTLLCTKHHVEFSTECPICRFEKDKKLNELLIECKKELIRLQHVVCEEDYDSIQKILDKLK